MFQMHTGNSTMPICIKVYFNVREIELNFQNTLAIVLLNWLQPIRVQHESEIVEMLRSGEIQLGAPVVAKGKFPTSFEGNSFIEFFDYPGADFITKPKAKKYVTAASKAIASTWAIFIGNLLMALIAGIIMWALVSRAAILLSDTIVTVVVVKRVQPVNSREHLDLHSNFTVFVFLEGGGGGGGGFDPQEWQIPYPLHIPMHWPEKAEGVQNVKTTLAPFLLLVAMDIPFEKIEKIGISDFSILRTYSRYLQQSAITKYLLFQSWPSSIILHGKNRGPWPELSNYITYHNRQSSLRYAGSRVWNLPDCYTQLQKNPFTPKSDQF